MNNQELTAAQTQTPIPTATPPPGNSERRRRLLYAMAALSLIVVVVLAVLVGRKLGSKQVVSDSTKLDKSTLLVDSKSHSVGVGVSDGAEGLEVQSTVTSSPQGSANIRMGLIKGTDPSILFEDNQKNSWQLLAAGGSVQFIQGTETRAKLDANALTLSNSLNVLANTTLGSDANSLLTVQGNKVAIPNNLVFGDNTLSVEASKGSVAVGAPSAGGYKLLVAGTAKFNSSIFTDGQVLAAAGSAKSPSFSFTNNTNTGLYEAGLNVVGIAAAGSQVLQVQPGSVLTVNGANFEVDGYLRAGRSASSPSFQVLRFTGTLDGAGAAVVADGITNGGSRILSIQAFYRGNGNEAIPLGVDSVSGGSFQITGGLSGRQYRATIIYSADNAGW